MQEAGGQLEVGAGRPHRDRDGAGLAAGRDADLQRLLGHQRVPPAHLGVAVQRPHPRPGGRSGPVRAHSRRFSHLGDRTTLGRVINAAHALIYSTDAEADRAFLRDVLGWPWVDDGDGWLIFALPPAEVGVHPVLGEGKPHHELYLMCDDVHATVRELSAQGVRFAGEVVDVGFGLHGRAAAAQRRDDRPVRAAAPARPAAALTPRSRCEPSRSLSARSSAGPAGASAGRPALLAPARAASPRARSVPHPAPVVRQPLGADRRASSSSSSGTATRRVVPSARRASDSVNGWARPASSAAARIGTGQQVDPVRDPQQRAGPDRGGQLAATEPQLREPVCLRGRVRRSRPAPRGPRSTAARTGSGRAGCTAETTRPSRTVSAAGLVPARPARPAGAGRSGPGRSGSRPAPPSRAATSRTSGRPSRCRAVSTGRPCSSG